jgi:hypothetical protein
MQASISAGVGVHIALFRAGGLDARAAACLAHTDRDNIFLLKISLSELYPDRDLEFAAENGSTRPGAARAQVVRTSGRSLEGASVVP